MNGMPRARSGFSAGVDWFDATTSRPGWQSRYTRAGGRLRSVAIPHDVVDLLAPCWIAMSVPFGVQPAADEATLRAAHVVRTVVQRGMAPPIHPDAGAMLLSMAATTAAGTDRFADAVGCLRQPRSSVGGLDPALRFRDTDRETAALIARTAPLTSRWTLPLVSLATLARSTGDIAANARRAGFLVAVPGEEAWLIDHGDPDIDLPDDPPAVHDPVMDPLVWGPMQVHRLVMALVDARVAGLLQGERWCIELDDPTGLSIHLIAPYLDLLAAADALQPGGGFAADEVCFQTVSGTSAFRRIGARYETIDMRWPEGTFVRVHLDCFSSPAEPMPNTFGLAHVIVRSASLPARLLADRPAPIVHHTHAAPPDQDNVAEALTVLLETVFAKRSFREGQLEALTEIVSGHGCLALLPSAAGKSLIYQLAALCRPGCALVVDPLSSLMDDQIRTMATNGIERVASLPAEASPAEVDAALTAMRSGELLLLLVAPEHMRSVRFRTAMTRTTGHRPVSVVVVDEAHCVSEWSHDFRTAYVDFGAALRSGWRGTGAAAAPVLALTATASRVVQIDVMHQLGLSLQREHSLVRSSSFDRPELSFEVHDCASHQTLSTLRTMIESVPARLGEPAAGFFDLRGPQTNAGLVFCTARTGWDWSTEKSSGVLAEITKSPHAEYSGTLGREGARIAAAFADDQLIALSTTKAYGMGIDRPNIRWIVHNGLPTSIEAYYQEIGRASRDGRRGHCMLLLTEFDRHRNDTLMQADSINDLRNVVDRPGGRVDNVISALHFHLSWFGGVDDEIADVQAMLDGLQIDGAPGMRAMTLEPGGDLESKRLDRAVLRLIQLGAVADVFIDTRPDGRRDLSVRTLEMTDESVVGALAAYVKRSQPGRSDAVVARVAGLRGDVREILDACVTELVTFVYGTVERARRRSLREMLFAARAAANGGDLRQLILDFMADGDMRRTLDRIVADDDTALSRWLGAWDRVTTQVDAQGLRNASARLLESYPTHPWLLISRALGELLWNDAADLVAAEADLVAAVHSSRNHYGIDVDHVAYAFEYAATRCAASRDHPERGITILSAAMTAGLTRSRQDAVERQLSALDSDAGLAVLQLNRRLRETLANLAGLDGLGVLGALDFSEAA